MPGRDPGSRTSTTPYGVAAECPNIRPQKRANGRTLLAATLATLMTGCVAGTFSTGEGVLLARCLCADLEPQNRASLPATGIVIQKFSPSLHAPSGLLLVENVPIGVKSAAFHSDTLGPE
jgi:hypothetical protein